MAKREAAIDYLKVLGIVAVVWIHAYTHLTLLPPTSRLVFVLRQITLFAVPGFFFASGFLYYQERPIPWPVAGRRWRRILVPYAIASLPAEAWMAHIQDQRLRPEKFAFDLATGNAFGHYYFIPLLTFMILFALLLSRAPRASRPLLVILFLSGVLSTLQWIPPGYFFWRLRSPLHWGTYFVLGWVVRGYWPRITAWPAARRAAASALCGALILLDTLFLWRQADFQWHRGVAVVSYFANHVVILGIILTFAEARLLPGVRWLSDVTYCIYLYHMFFILAAMQVLGSASAGEKVLVWLAGLAASIVLCLGARALLGPERARAYLGA